MNTLTKAITFEKELSHITNPNIKQFTIEAIKTLPDYFFNIPASSSGKYHPSYALGQGGLVRHTKAAVGIAIELFKICDFILDEQDCIVSALILHDGMKLGINNSENTVHEHPMIIVDYLHGKDYLTNLINDIHLNNILNSISSHMGKWVASKYSDCILPQPQTKLEQCVHVCDYLASRKCLEFNFDV